MVDFLGSDLFAACDAEEFPNLLGILDQFVGGKPDLADQFLRGGKERLGKDAGIFGEDAIDQGMGVTFHVAGRLKQSMAVPHQQPQFRDLRIGNARGFGLSRKDQPGNGLRVDLVVARLANAGPAAGIGLQGVENHAGIAASRSSWYGHIQ